MGWVLILAMAVIAFGWLKVRRHRKAAQ